jgi:hypothetical protein
MEYNMELESNTRRNFLKKSSLALGAIYSGSTLRLSGLTSSCTSRHVTTPISKLKKPDAITMWDCSWTLRHHRYGSFENWEKTLDAHADRGDNAIRIDIMPQFSQPIPMVKYNTALGA